MDIQRAQQQLNTEEGHKRFIDNAWSYLAAIAYGKFLAQGRGAVYVDLGLAEHIGFDFCTAPARYIVEGKPLLGVEANWAVRNYDPQREIVVLLWLPNEDFASYVIKGKLTPPEAYLAQLEKPLCLTSSN